MARPNNKSKKNAKAEINSAAKIRSLRLARGMTATDLAVASRIGLPEVSLLERGALGLGLVRAQRIANALQIDIAELLGPNARGSR